MRTQICVRKFKCTIRNENGRFSRMLLQNMVFILHKNFNYYFIFWLILNIFCFIKFFRQVYYTAVQKWPFCKNQRKNAFNTVVSENLDNLTTTFGDSMIIKSSNNKASSQRRRKKSASFFKKHNKMIIAVFRQNKCQILKEHPREILSIFEENYRYFHFKSYSWTCVHKFLVLAHLLRITKN